MVKVLKFQRSLAKPLQEVVRGSDGLKLGGVHREHSRKVFLEHCTIMIDRITISPRLRSGIIGESTNDESYGVLNGEDRLVREIMTRQIFIAQASISVDNARESMRNQKMPILIVLENGDPVQALTELDLSNDNITRENSSNSGTLQGIITSRVSVRSREDAILADAIRAMVCYRASHIPVVDPQGGLVGALSLVDAIGALSPPAAELWSAKMRGWSVTPPPLKQ